MPSDGLADDVRSFIRHHIDSVEALEILRLLHRDPRHAWTPDEVAAELRTSQLSAVQRLDELVRRRLVLKREGQGFQYAPASLDLERGARALFEAYRDRRVSVITEIFSKPDPLCGIADKDRNKR